ncbi:MAG: 3-phosphoshikimate 1-carboxyvinyltransferase [Methanobacteriota archaeon]|nr:MAG: 3-phosphoshikimate 1-carboxyvinyltransferase [Euryarchaeota archaeon]
MTLLKLLARSSSLNGTIVAPPSKSYTHRAVICASLASGTTTIREPLFSDDIEATLDASRAIGANIVKANSKEIVIEGVGGKPAIREEKVNCRESGSTARFFLPIMALADGEIVVTGKPGLRRRPISEVLRAMEGHGIAYSYLGEEGKLPVKIGGKLRGGEISIRGDVSSQYITALMFALPLVEEDSVLRITTELQSRDYIDITMDVLSKFGIVIENRDYKEFIIKGGQQYKAIDYRVEGDYSSAAFFLVGGAIGGNVKVENLTKNSKQGDKAIVDILRDMGASTHVGDDYVAVSKSELKAIDIDAKNIPDLVPILAILASQASGTTTIRNVERLIIKESNRLEGTIEMVKAFGGTASYDGEKISIQGPVHLRGSSPNTRGDHRFTMSVAIAALVADGETTIDRPTDIKKSYPAFFEHYRELGGDVMTLQPAMGVALKTYFYGDSHGKRVGFFMDGMPSGIEVSPSFVEEELDKRRSKSKLTTPRREEDKPIIISGLSANKTDGNRVRVEIRNKDTHSSSYKAIKELLRPGHGDLTAKMKFASVFDYRGSGFLSARLTAPVVAAGAFAKKLLLKHGVKVLAHTVQIGGVKLDRYVSDEEIEENREESPVKCADLNASKLMAEEVERARQSLDSVGGVIEGRVVGLPVGVGEPRTYALDSMIAKAMLSIPAAKGVEFGAGFSLAEMRGSESNDSFTIRDGRIVTTTNNMGGVLGGMSNGMPVVFRVVFKPTSSIAREQDTVNIATMENAKISVGGRHDPCVAIRASPIVEAMAALTVADLMLCGGFIKE